MAQVKTGWFKQSIRHSNAKRLGHAGGRYAGFRGQKKLDYLLKQHETGNILPYQEKELLDLSLARMEYNKNELPKTPLYPRLPKDKQKELKYTFKGDTTHKRKIRVAKPTRIYAGDKVIGDFNILAVRK